LNPLKSKKSKSKDKANACLKKHNGYLGCFIDSVAYNGKKQLVFQHFPVVPFTP